jgi:AcrR family transcriptional regulator
MGESLRWVREPKQARSQKTMERLLAAAEQRVMEVGFERTTVADVARLAGSSVGAFYTRFPDKEALLHCLFDRFIEQAQATVDAALAPELWRDQTIEELAGALLTFMFDVLEERRNLISALADLTARQPALACLRDVLGEHLAIRVAALLEERGERISRPDPASALRAVSWVFLSSIELAVTQGRLSPQGLDKPQLIAELSEMILAYLQVQKIQERER